MYRRLAVLALAAATFALVVAGLASGTLGPKYGKGETATLNGTVEVPAGDPDATGTATVRLDPAEGLVCFDVSITNVDLPMAAAHIHKSPVGVAGAVVVPIATPAAATGSTTATSKGCVSADAALIQDIIDHPDQYYVNAHNKQYPGGALRGQLTAFTDPAPPAAAKPTPKPKPKPKPKHKKPVCKR